jgi:hypothetical protein
LWLPKVKDMRREFSSLLILLLLLLSPVSYSSENIPDFSPECQLTELYGQKVTMAAVCPVTEVLPPPVTRRGIEKFTPPRCVVTRVIWSKTSSFGRAPPA